MRASSCPHAFLGMTSQGLAAIVRTSGNPDVHVILRGGTSGPNYAAEHVQSAAAKLAAARKDSLPSIMVDASHGNSSKNYLNQPKVVADVAEQIRKGDKSITGIMIESNINPGRQDIPTDGSALKPFVSVTDACIDWESTYVCSYTWFLSPNVLGPVLTSPFLCVPAAFPSSPSSTRPRSPEPLSKAFPPPTISTFCISFFFTKRGVFRPPFLPVPSCLPWMGAGVYH